MLRFALLRPLHSGHQTVKLQFSIKIGEGGFRLTEKQFFNLKTNH